MKRLFILILVCLMLIACVPTPDEPIVVQKDTDRLVDTVVSQDAEQNEAETFRIEPVDGQYQYDYVNDSGHLRIHVDADVSIPESGTIPMMRVKAVGLSDEFTMQAFDTVYQGTPVYLRSDFGMKTKREFAEEIAYYQELIESGRTAEEEMDEQGALEEIEYLKEMYEKAPLEAEVPEKILSDGTMQVEHFSNQYGDQTQHQLEIYDDIAYFSVERTDLKDGTILSSSYHYKKGPIDDALGYMEYKNGREFQNWYSDLKHDSVSPHAAECAYGQSLSPQDANAFALKHFHEIGLDDIEPFCTCDLYIANTKNGIKSLYVIDYVRTVDGCHTAFIPHFQDAHGYSEHEFPWMYETIRAIVNDEGVTDADWRNPVDVTATVSENVHIMSFEGAKNIFELMCETVYEPQVQIGSQTNYADIEVNHVELSLIRVREQNADKKVGLYVPAWVFYGTHYYGAESPEKIDRSTYLTSIIFAINAVDGSIIDISKGY